MSLIPRLYKPLSPDVESLFDRGQMYKLLEVYEPCISTASAADWPRHRNTLAAPFNETAMGVVWSESLQQTEQMVEAWSSPSSGGITSVAKDIRILSLKVLAAIGFRRSFSFRQADDSVGIREGVVHSYRDALQIVLENLILLMLIPSRHLVYPWLPASLRRIGNAALDFKKHMVKMFDEENTSMNRGDKGSGSLMTSFIRALDVWNKGVESNVSQGLSVMRS
ncbi:hypothetical protein DPSP01_011239 [Paraphaeosphaeria sporulosa]